MHSEYPKSIEDLSSCLVESLNSLDPFVRSMIIPSTENHDFSNDDDDDCGDDIPHTHKWDGFKPEEDEIMRLMHTDPIEYEKRQERFMSLIADNVENCNHPQCIAIREHNDQVEKADKWIKDVADAMSILSYYAKTKLVEHLETQIDESDDLEWDDD